MTSEGVSARSPIDGFVARVAADIRDPWRQSRCTLESLPSIAAQALSDGMRREPITGSDVVAWTLQAPELPFQPRLDETFGQPPVTLYHDGDFQLDALFWVQGSTDVHAHGFSGAFAVLDGQSVHARFEFAERQRIDEHFMIGRVATAEAELIDVGAVREIHGGTALIHSVVHLGRPSVTLVARTCAQADLAPEYAYFPPAIALDPSKGDALRKRTVQLIRMLIRSGSAELGATVERLIGRSDPHTAFMVIRELSRHPVSSALVNPALKWSAQRWPEMAVPFGESLTADLRHAAAVKLLPRVTEPHHRVVLGALAALDEPEQVRGLLKKYVPVETDALIEGFVSTLHQTGALSIPADRPYDHLLLRPLALATATATAASRSNG